MIVPKFRYLLLSIIILLTLAPISKSQAPGGTTQVIGVVKDPLGNLYTNSQISFIFYDPGTSGKLPLLNGSTFQQTFTGYATDSFGNIPPSIYLPDNGLIAGSSGATGTQWIVKVCYSDRVTCFSVNLTINCMGNQPATCTSGIIDLTSILQAAAATLPAVPGTPGGTTGSVQCNNANHFIACPDATDLGGVFNISGKLRASNINNIITVDGVKYPTLAAAFADAACTTACTIDMRGNSSGTALVLGAFNPGSKEVTLLLGPFNYTTSGIALQSYLNIYGDARGATTLTSTNTTSPIFTLGSTGAVYSVHLEDMIVFCGAGNASQIGFNLIAGSGGGGLNYSTFKDLTVGGDGVHECGGESFLFDGSAGGSPPAINQFITMINVQAFRKINGAPALHLRGVNGQFYIYGSSQFDGSGTRDTLPNVVVEDSSFGGFAAAYTIVFNGTTIQRGGIGIQVKGVTGLTCDTCHFENVSGMISASIGQHYGNRAVAIRNSYCAVSCGVNSSAGYLVTLDSHSQVNFDNNAIQGTPDHFWLGTLTYLEYQGLRDFGSDLLYPAPNSGLRIPVGLDCDSPGYKCATAAVTGISAGAYAEVDITWTTPFADASYIPVCVVYDGTTGTTSAGLRFDRLAGSGAFLSPTGLKAVVFNASGGTLSGSLLCTATHIGGT